MAHQEAKELLPAIAGGMDGIKDYFKFWNLVDWILDQVAIPQMSWMGKLFGTLKNFADMHIVSENSALNSRSCCVQVTGTHTHTHAI